MNVYDFDNTIYDGESSFDFFLFCFKRKKSMIKFMLPVVFTMLRYKLCMITTEQLIEKCEKYMAEFLKMLDNPKKLICDFWDTHEHKIKSFYLRQKREDDVIISASNDLFLEEICKRLGVKNLVASKMDLVNNKIEYLCHNENKVKIFKSLYPDGEIDEFYTDSKNDLPMMRLAKKAFFVKGDRITEYKVN